jgi:hypothetical protein
MCVYEASQRHPEGAGLIELGAKESEISGLYSGALKLNRRPIGADSQKPGSKGVPPSRAQAERA